MKLTDFIQQHMDEIIEEWEVETFATLPEISIRKEESRNYMSLLLTAIIKRIQYRMVDGSQLKDPVVSTMDIPKCLEGYNMRQIITGLWTLRSLVIKQWGESIEDVGSFNLKEIICFNEELDRILKESEASRWYVVNYDETTGTPNRRLFFDRLEQSILHSHNASDSFAFFHLNIDRWKEINKKWGHKIGDRILREFSDRLKSCISDHDTVSRTAGDEFGIVILKVMSLDEVDQLARKILDKLRKPFLVESSRISLTASIGITIFPDDGISIDALISNADQAMLMAKESGRDQVCFFSDVRIKKLDDSEKLIKELREAIKKGELRLYYQPIIDLKTGVTKKAEALIRWEHPTRGLLYPGDFLPLAEESGLMGDIEHWVFAEAAANLSRWTPLASDSFQITINTSPVHFMKRIVDKHGKKPWASHIETITKSGTGVVIELTEDVFMKDSKYLQGIFTEIFDAGIELALDDFGTGYSSLAYLKNFRVHYIKIDRMFVRGNASGSINQTIAETMIIMAHKIGMKVVAEGVETESERDWLRDIGCDMAQGFLFSKALPPEALASWLRGDKNHLGIHGPVTV